MQVADRWILARLRHELFERLDQPALRPLAPTPFIYGEWVTARRPA